MMNLKRTIAGVLIGLCTLSQAQEFSGVATYKSKQNVELDIDTAQLQGMGSQIMEMLKKEFEKDFTLKFNKNESLYTEDKALESPQPAGMVIMVDEAGGSDHIYKNTKEKRYVNQSESLGKVFLIKDKLADLDWKLLNETKTIGNYTCYKAILKREVEVMEGEVLINPTDEDIKDPKTKLEEREVVAWYTTQIPVNAGPGEFYGLPGLILQVTDGDRTIICSKIKLNPKTKLEIKEPVKGKVITQEKYNAVMKKKLKQMQEMSSQFDGEGLEIRIEQ